MINRILQTYAALSKRASRYGDDSALARLRPDLAERERISSNRTVAAQEIERFVPHANLYRSYVWVYRAINVITTAVAPLPVRVVGKDDVPVPNHPLEALLRRPNAIMDGAELAELMLIHKLLGGEWFVEVVRDQRGRPAELWPRRPDEVWVIADGANAGYPIPLAYEVPTVTNPMFLPSDMIHEMYINPLNAWRGLSPLRALWSEVQIDLATIHNAQRSITDGTRSYAITADQALTPDERRRAEAQLEEKYGRHRPILLEGGQKIQVLGHVSDDLDWLDARDDARDAVAAAFGVPPEIMGFGKDTYENFNTAYRVFWKLTLWPMCDRRDQTLTHFFRSHTALLKPHERLLTDTSDVEVLQDELTPKLEQARQLWAIGVPYNTIEAMLQLGTGPVSGGEVGYLPASVLPATMMSQPQPPVERAIAKSFNPQLIGAQLRTAKMRVVRTSVAGIEAAFDRLADEVEARARATQKDASQLSLDALLPLDGEDWGLVAVIRPAIIEVARESWPVWNAALGLELAFDQSDPAVVEAVRQAGTRITAINATTRQAVRDLLEHATTEGWSIQQVIDGNDEWPGLRSVVAQTYQRRAETIARTELGYAQATATVNRYRRANITHVMIHDNGVEDSDEFCKIITGTRQTLEWYQANQLQHPNCLRVASPIVED